MKKIVLLFLSVIACATVALAQGTVKGKVLDKANSEALGFVSVVVSPKGSDKMVGGGTTDIDGNFHVNGLKNGTYTLTLSFVGYKEVKREFTITDQNNHKTFTALYMAEDSHLLNEVQVTGQRSTMKLEVDRKVFDVASNIANIGMTASEVLDNIPSVEVDNDGNVSLRGSGSVEVWINGRSAGLTSDNMGQVLQQIPSESIDHIEVLDNPSAKFSAEGSSGIINIVLKKDRKAGYYGSVQAGGDTQGGANTGINFNYSSSKVDFFVNVGYRHRENEGRSVSEMRYDSGEYIDQRSSSRDMGNNLFTRAGVTFHFTDNDELALTGMYMHGLRKSWNDAPYRYGFLVDGKDTPTRTLFRSTRNSGPMDMMNGNINYRHTFNEGHLINFTVGGNSWKSKMDDVYQDSTRYFGYVDPKTSAEIAALPTSYNYQHRPMDIDNGSWEAKIEYENKISDSFKLEAGYNGRFSKENTPNERWDATDYNGVGAAIVESEYNHFIYKSDVHAGYITTNFKFGDFGLMAGLRGEYWNVDTESRGYDQEQKGEQGNRYKKDFFQLFPSIFMTYQLTPSQQLQLNYARRLRRPWGGELNSFRNTSDATSVRFGNPELTPEYSNSFSLNYLKTWDQHSILVSAYYRPTTDVIQHVNYRGNDGKTMYSTSMNVAKSQSEGVEITGKNKLFNFLDLTSNVNVYYYKIDAFSHKIAIDDEGNPVSDGSHTGFQTVTGPSQERFTWNARVTASFKLPYDISIQTTGRYNSRQAISQGYRPASYMVDLGIKKNFLNRLFTLSINCRDLLDSRQWENFTEGDGYTRYTLNKRGGRKVNFTLTWNFGNGSSKKQRRDGERGEDNEDEFNGSGYDM